MSPNNPLVQDAQARWALGLSVLTGVLAVLLGPVTYYALPPAIYVYPAIVLALAIPTVVLGLLGLKAAARKRAIAALILLGLAAILFTSLAVAGLRNIPLKLLLVEIETETAPACTGRGTPDAAAYSPGPDIHPAVAVESVAVRPVTDGWLPREYWPDSLARVELVVCIGYEYTETVETCPYTDGTTKERIRFLREVRLVAARSGETLAVQVIAGSPPDECPVSTEQGNSKPIKGGRPSSTELAAWLQAFLYP